MVKLLDLCLKVGFEEGFCPWWKGCTGSSGCVCRRLKGNSGCQGLLVGGTAVGREGAALTKWLVGHQRRMA